MRETLREALGGRARPARPTGLDLGPASAYEAITRQMVDDVRGELAEIRLRLNGLLFVVVAAIVVDVVMRLTR